MKTGVNEANVNGSALVWPVSYMKLIKGWFQLLETFDNINNKRKCTELLIFFFQTLIKF